MDKKVTCRPCKDKPGTWEIVKPNGSVYSVHYKDKSECVKQAEKFACEYACEMNIVDKDQTKN